MKSFENDVLKYLSKLEELTNDFLGIDIKYVASKNKRGAVDVKTETRLPLKAPGLTEELTSKILGAISTEMKRAVNVKGELDYNLFRTLTEDISLSLVFSTYFRSRTQQKYNIQKFADSIKEIGSKTYENQPANIGVIFCPDAASIVELKQCDLEYIELAKKRTVHEFFLSEKPFLKLIDSQSLMIVIDKKFEVFAIIRKKSGKTSLCDIFENMYNQCTINDVKMKVLKSFVEETSINKGKIPPDSPQYEVYTFIEEALTKRINTIPSKVYPKFIYIAVTDKKVNYFTSNKFIISHQEGKWKIRQYHLLTACIMRFIFVNMLHYLVKIKLSDFEVLMNSITDGVTKLTSIIKGISSSHNSSIFIMLANELLTSELSITQTRKLMETPLFNSNNVERNFIKVAQNGGNSLNILNIDKYLMNSIATVDGAVVLDSNLNILSYGEIVNVPKEKKYPDTFGSGTKATRAASEHGIAIKISEDGDIKLFQNEKLLLQV